MNAPAYYENLELTAVKSFITLAPGVSKSSKNSLSLTNRTNTLELLSLATLLCYMP